MQPMDEEDFLSCTQCGSPIRGMVDRPYPYGSDEILCFECSVARGGVYDDHYDRWLTAPDLPEFEENG